MTPEELIAALQELKVWKRGAQRAPHKALLLLLTLGRLNQDKPRLRPYTEIAPELTELLGRFGPPRRTPHPEAPFLRLEPALWDIPGVEPSERSSLLISDLQDAFGGLPEPVFELLKGDPELVARAANLLLRSEFEESYHDEILEAVGLNAVADVVDRHAGSQSRRDPEFRIRVIQAYSYRCAVCGYGTRLHNELLAVEAAHILWHSKGGPDVVPNGLALCAIHHRALDKGAISLDDDLNLLVSPQLNGHQAVESLFFRFEGKQIIAPRKAVDMPNPEFLHWHRQEVYRGRHT